MRSQPVRSSQFFTPDSYQKHGITKRSTRPDYVDQLNAADHESHENGGSGKTASGTG